MSRKVIEREKDKDNRIDDTCQMSTLLISYWLIVIIAKVIRYTLLKKTLVNMSIGNSWVSGLNAGMNHFILSLSGDSVASMNSKALFQVFRFLGLSTYRDYELVITLIWNIIFFCILLKLKNRIRISQMIFLMMSVAVLNIWDFCLAKEPLQMIFFVVIFYVFISKVIPEKYKFPIAVLIILFSSISYRNYYTLIVVFSLLSYVLIKEFVLKKQKSTISVIIRIIVFFALIYICVIIFSKHFNHEAYNSFMYFNRRETVARTDLSGLFHSQNYIIMAVDYIILVLRMLFPIELIRFGPQYWLYVLYQMLVSGLFIKSIKNIRHNHRIQNYALVLFIGFLFTSATFEPDFGSWVRHEAVVIPIIILMSDFFDYDEIDGIERKEIVDEE